MPIAENFRPIYKISIKNPSGTPSSLEFNSWYFKGSTPTKQKQLNKLAIYVDRDLGKKLDLCMIIISLRGGALTNTASSLKVTDIKVGAEVKVYLGYAKNENEDTINLTDDDLAFTGIVDEVEQSLKSISITAFSMAYKIIAKKAETNKFPPSNWDGMEKNTKEIITNFLTGTALSMDDSNCKDGLKFKSYTPDTEKSIYDNIKQLSDYNGFNLYVSKDGKLRFHDSSSNTPQTLEYGKDILEYKITMAKPPYEEVDVELNYKDSGDSDKNKTENTPSYDPLTGTAAASGGQQSKNTKKVDFGWSCDQNTAKTVAKNILKNMYVTETGEVKTLGNPKLDLQDKVTISFGTPSTYDLTPGAKDLNFMRREDVIITRITHRFGRKSGFITSVEWKKEPNIR